MKRILLFTVATLAIVSCSKEPISETITGSAYDPSKVVVFSTDPITRGTPIDDVSQMTDMGTFGYYTGQNNWTSTDLPNRMFNKRLYYSSGAWIYDGAPVQWNGSSITDKFTFYAYAPYATASNGIVVNGNSSTPNVPTLTYTVPTDVTKQPDLMVATPCKDIIKPVSGFVSMQMEHALTTVGFQIAGDGEKIKSLSISGVSMTGTLKVDGGTIAWSGLGSPTTTDFSASINYDSGKNYYTTTSTMSTNLMKGNGYLMMIPQTLGANAKLMITYDDNTTKDIDLNTHQWLPGKKITYEITIEAGVPTLPPTIDGGGTRVGTTPYVGAFWRANQTGERLIRIPVTTAGKWAVQVYERGDFAEGDIVFSKDASTDAGITWNAGTEAPADMNTSDATYQVTGTDVTLLGEVAAGGYIFFRIGLKSKWTPTEAKPARYATIVLSYSTDDGTTYTHQKLFLRQGEGADYLMRPGDTNGSGEVVGNNRDKAKRISPYNLTALSIKNGTNTGGPNISNHVQLAKRSTLVPGAGGTGGGVFTDYPSQAGALFQWKSDDSPRYAYHPVNDAGALTGWENGYPSPYWDDLKADNETCPPGYRRPNDGATNSISLAHAVDSEIRQSLDLNPFDYTNAIVPPDINVVWGYYADGFFDRRIITSSVSSIPNSSVAKSSGSVAYVGHLFYNPNSNASLFLPATGSRFHDDGHLYNAGLIGPYWSSSVSDDDSLPWFMVFLESYISYGYTSVSNGNAVRCVQE